MNLRRPAQRDVKAQDVESRLSDDSSKVRRHIPDVEKCDPSDADSPTQMGNPSGNEDAKPPQMSKWSFRLLIISVTISTLLIAFNGTVLGTAIPSITSEFGTVDDVGWYSSAYLISNCVMVPLVGKLYKIFRLKLLFITFIAIFELGSLISALSRSSMMLIISRAISGIGGSGILNGGATILAATIPIAERSFLNGVILGCFAIGQAVGPLIGGALTQALSWRWCFYINLPIGGFVIFLFVVVVRLPIMTLSQKELPMLDKILAIDVVGFFTFGAACTMFLLGLQWGGTEYAWNSSMIIGLICAGVVTFGLLGGWFAYKGESALIPPRLLYNRINIMITITSFVQSGATITALYWLPVWFQAIRGANAFHSGVMILPLILSQLVSSVISGAVVQKTGYYLPEVILGNWYIIVGVGRGLVLQLLVTAMQANVPQEDASIASAYAMFSQYLGGALFAGVAKTIFTSSVGAALRKFAPEIDPSLLIDSGVTEIAGVVPADQLKGALLAYNEAIDHVFYLQLAAACCAFVTGWGMGWRNLKKIKQEKEAEKANGLALVIQGSNTH
ncbi:MFS general substrate transporter [Whalleya microplaca]|nr:MFS general substrate transporter [Whalleya microplaca]